MTNFNAVICLFSAVVLFNIFLVTFVVLNRSPTLGQRALLDVYLFCLNPVAVALIAIFSSRQ